jgi:hypothetical protein
MQTEKPEQTVPAYIFLQQTVIPKSLTRLRKVLLFRKHNRA